MENKPQNELGSSAVTKVIVAIIVAVVVQIALVYGVVQYAQQGDMKLEAEVLRLRKEINERKMMQ